MLILSRKRGQSIVIGDNITITVKEIRGKNVKLSIQTPLDVPVFRQELFEDIARETRRAMTQAKSTQDLPVGPKLKLEPSSPPKEEL